LESNPLIIAGSGRSGTTWVLDVLAETNNLRPVFEPLNPLGVGETRFFCNRYVREKAYEPELKCFMEKVFTGKLNYLWPKTRIVPAEMPSSISQMTSWDYNYTLLSQYTKILIRYSNYARKKSFRPITKFIRANLMLDWLAANFNPRILFLVRHPGAVAASKISAAKTKAGAVWDFNGPNEQKILFQYKQDEQLRKDYLDKYYEIFSEKLSPIAGHTLLWCIENILPVYNQQKKKRYVFFYEDIVKDPEKEFDRMVKVLSLERKPDSAIIAQPSQQASQEMRNRSFEENQLTRWMKSFNQEQLGEIDKILKFFKVTTYNAYEPMPVNRTQDFI
jgi:Sulfotransferase domain